MSSFDTIIRSVPAMSRRGVLASAAGLVLAFSLPLRSRAQGVSKHARSVGAFLDIRPDGTIRLLNPFVEGGQGINTAMVQIVAEELDAEMAEFTVECAPAGADYLLMFGDYVRFTGGSLSVRSSYATMRTVGATARAMLIQAAAARWNLPAAGLTTRPGMVVAPDGRSLSYGALAADAALIAPPADVPLKAPSTFRLIGKRVARVDARAKSTGKATYSIDTRIEGMLYGFVLHGPRLGATPERIANLEALKAMPGVRHVAALPQGVGVVADSWWRAKTAAEAAEVTWTGGLSDGFSSASMRETLKAGLAQPGVVAEAHGDAPGVLAKANQVIEAEYDAPYLAHAQLEPPSCTARFNADGGLELWLQNQAPEVFQIVAAAAAGLKPEQVKIHSPMIGGFFGRHFTYNTGDAFPEAIALARIAGAPVKLLWSREEEFKRDAYRPLGHLHFRATLDDKGMPLALHARVPGEGATGRYNPQFLPNKAIDDSAVEGIVEKPYAIPNRRVDYIKVVHPTCIGYWRSVGHSMNDFFYESFLDELAVAGKHDPFEYRLALLKESKRHTALLRGVADLAGGWKRGPYNAPDGSVRARGVAMASPFGSEVATIAEVSVNAGEAVVHNLWIAIDPGSIVNPAIIEAQVRSAATIGLSSALLEQMVLEKGEPQASNYDSYPILARDRMPAIHSVIVESGAPMGGIGEPATPGVPPAVANAIAALTGQRIRALPLVNTKLGKA